MHGFWCWFHGMHCYFIFDGFADAKFIHHTFVNQEIEFKDFYIFIGREIIFFTVDLTYQDYLMFLEFENQYNIEEK